VNYFPILYTERLILRQITADDIQSLVKYANNKNISNYVLNIPHPYEEHHAVYRLSYVYQGFKNKTHYAFGIINREPQEFIGEVSLHLDSNNTAQLAYWVAEPYWNKGIASEAAGALLDFGKSQLPLSRIYAEFEETNTASERVLMRNNMKKKGISSGVVRYEIVFQENGDPS